MDQRLKDFEARRIASRSLPPHLNREILAAQARLGLEPGNAFAAVCRELIKRLTEEAASSEAEYHNLHHVQDVVDAAALLLSSGGSAVDAQLGEVLLIAALGHDLHHDGRAVLRERDLERRSALTVAGICRSCGYPPDSLVLVEALIVSTHPPEQFSLRSNIGRDAPRDPACRMKLVLGEADVLASLTPELGRELSLCLEKEWLSAGVDVNQPPSTPDGRRQFLTAYQCLSAEALNLGVDVMIAEQLNAGGNDRS